MALFKTNGEKFNAGSKIPNNEIIGDRDCQMSKTGQFSNGVVSVFPNQNNLAPLVSKLICLLVHLFIHSCINVFIK